MTASTHLQAHLQLFFSGSKIFYGCKRACKFPAQVKLFFKIPSLQIFLKRNRTTHDRTVGQQLCNKTISHLQTVCKLDTKDRTAGHNNGFKKLAVQWLIEHLSFVSSVVLADSFVLRNRQLLKPANRCVSC
jgi:hypothetical protein